MLDTVRLNYAPSLSYDKSGLSGPRSRSRRSPIRKQGRKQMDPLDTEPWLSVRPKGV